MAVDIAAASVRITPNMAGFGAATQAGVKTSMAGTAAAASKLGGTLTAAVALPVAAIGVASVKAFASFDEAMNSSLAIMGNVSDAMREDMAQAAKDVSTITTVSASEAAEAYFFLASAGLDAAQSMAALPQVAKFAQAGMFDMAQATDLATDAQSALGLTVPDAVQNLTNLTRITDVLVKANTLANASVEQFSTALTSKAGTALKLVNKSIEEGVAVLAVYADKGIKGSIAGENLSRVLRGLMINAEANADAFEDYGIAVFDADGNMRNMADIVDDITVAFADLSDVEATAALAQLGFTARQQDTVKALIGTGDAIREYQTKLEAAAGATDQISKKQLESFSAQLKLAKNRIEVAAIALGAQFAPAVAAAAGAVASLVEGFMALPGPLKNAIILTSALAGAAGIFLLIGGRVAQSIVALKALQTAQLAAAGTAGTLAAAEATAAGAITTVGVASARTAAVVAGSTVATGGAVGAVATGTALRTSLVAGATAGAASRGGAKAFISRALGFGSGASAAKASVGIGAKLGKGLGIAFVGELGGSIVQALPTQSGTIGDQLKDTAANAVKGAALGAAIGSVVPALGTGVGAVVGGVIGGAIGLIRSKGEKPIAEAVVDTVETASESAVAGLQASALDQVLNAELTRMLDEGLSIEDAGAAVGELGYDISQSLEEGLTFEEAITKAQDGGLLVAEAVVEGVEEGMDPNQIREFFQAGFDAGLTFDQIVEVAREGGIDIGGAAAAGVNIGLAQYMDIAFQPLDNIPNLFAGKLEPIKTIAASAMLATVTGIQERQAEFETGIGTLADAGLTTLASTIREKGPAALGELRGALANMDVSSEINGLLATAGEQTAAALVTQSHAQRALVEEFNANIATLAGAGATEVAAKLREKGPEAAAEAATLASNLGAAFNIEADLAGVAADDIGAFVEALEAEDVETASKIKAGEVHAAMEGQLTPAASRMIAQAYARTLQTEIDRILSQAASSARVRAAAINAAIQAGLSGSGSGGSSFTGDPLYRAGGGRVN
ncbi:MAG: phage tail tape measure protein, partial [Gammaproteobacteria bacterium]